MATISVAVEAEGALETSVRPAALAGPFIARMRDMLLKLIRELAWHMLDLETEFEVLDCAGLALWRGQASCQSTPSDTRRQAQR